MFLLLRRRNFALLWFGGLISLIGDRALLTALPFYIYQQTGSTLATALMFLAFYLPTLLLGSVAGVFVDRWDRKRLMVATNVLQGIVILFLLLVRSGEWLWVVYVVFFIEISLAMFFEPAEGALLPHLVEPEHLLAANGLNALNNNLARLVGPPLGAVLLASFGMNAVAIFDSVSFLLSAVLIALLAVPAASRIHRADATQQETPKGLGIWSEWREGLQLIGRNRIIANLVIVWALTSFGGAMFDPLIAPWVQTTLHGGAELLGWLSTTGAIGGILGGALLGRMRKGVKPAHFVGVGNIVGGTMLLVLYNLTVVPAVLALSFLKGVPLVATGAGLQTILQTSVPDSHRGRIYGALSTTNGVVGLAALGVAGLLGQVAGIVPMLSVAAGITIFAGVLAILLLPNTRLVTDDTQERI